MKALILVDIQNDFIPGGALAVPHGDQVIPVANSLQKSFDLIVATQDWHPPEHVSFAVNHPGKKVGEVIDLDGIRQALWPVHCVQNTRGADLASRLDRSKIARIFQKGTDVDLDSYSAFFDNAHRRSTGLGEWLKSRGVDRVYLCGLATDYCVKFSVLDALQLNFATYLIQDACRGIESKPGDVDAALAEMQSAGAILTSSNQLGSENSF